MLIALLLNLLGFALLALGQPRHRERIYGANGPVALVHPAQSATGFIAICLSLCASIASQGPSFGCLLWALGMSASAIAVALTLTWRPQWLRGLGITQPAASAATPALAICASSVDFTPLTPTAPRHCPSRINGTPPSNMPSSSGALKNDVRPPLIMSS